ncbi:MAG: C_GCAxxG_C_C family protein [Alistipes sp.]|nr:C_GCAxxG_C_C family protein [Alistipes sp.]
MEIDIEARAEAARANFKSGYNCAQSVVMAYADIIGLDKEFAAKMSASFGGGMGRMREVCGTVSGMSMLAGFLSPATDPSNMAQRKANYALVQDFAGKFRAENGSIVCRELLALDGTQPSAQPSERTPEYYRRRACADYVAAAARIVGEYIANNK